MDTTHMGAYDNAADSLEVCLPISSHPITLDFMQFQNDQGANATMQLEDIYGNVVWEVALSEVGSISETVYLSTGNLLRLQNSLLTNSEGGTQTARVSFSPSDAGQVSTTIEFVTNSPVTPLWKSMRR